jgi:tryptophanyl-tRNA synthetase
MGGVVRIYQSPNAHVQNLRLLLNNTMVVGAMKKIYTLAELPKKAQKVYIPMISHLAMYYHYVL